MTLAVHTAAALVISQHSGNHLQAFLIGLISHVLLDMIPHGDYHLFRWVKRGSKLKRMTLISEADVVVSTLIASIFFYAYAADISIFVWALLGSWLPDIPHMFFYLSKEKFMIRLNRWHNNIHFTEKWVKLSITQSMVMQGLVLIIMFLLL